MTIPTTKTPTDEQLFLDEIRSNPNDDAVRLVYADWLEERSDPRAEYVRAEVALHAATPGKAGYVGRRRVVRRLQLEHDPAWMLKLERTPIENCPIDFDFECPKRWEELTATNDPAVRDCRECRKSVYHCTTIAEAKFRAFHGECIAVDASLTRRSHDLMPAMFLGMPSQDDINNALKRDLKREQRKEARRRRKRRT